MIYEMGNNTMAFVLKICLLVVLLYYWFSVQHFFIF